MIATPGRDTARRDPSPGTGPIALFLPSLAGGGAERMMLNLAGGLAARGRPVDLVLARASGPYLDQVPSGVRVVDLDRGRVLAALARLTFYLRHTRPRALLAAMDHANIVALWARDLAGTGTRCLVSVRSNLSAETLNGRGLAARAMPRLARTFYRRAEAVVAVSRGVAADLGRHLRIEPSRLHVIHNPVVTPDLPTMAAAAPPHRWFAEDACRPVLLAAGRLVAQKDFPTLIRAFARVRAHHPARLVILGEGPERRSLERLTHELGVATDVDLPGFQPNPFGFFRSAALVVCSSAWEGLPGVLIQALACGTPVVSTDCRDGPREILEDGRLGRLVPVGDSLALADAILATLTAPPARAPLIARAADFALEPITDLYLALLEGSG
ncbi:glycosyltransferase [Thioalkalicoccus limnaeus]|uniref:Glycosyltransferase n=1 Tax=Thioalkalicoccus limnaeus TaxID=120681 RepID=A0ABV4BDV6_9GAMM